jgi:hypothetical protein
LLLSKAPKKTRWSRGLMASLNSAISLGSNFGLFTETPLPSGPLLNSHTGGVGQDAAVLHNKLCRFLQPVRHIDGTPDHEIVVVCWTVDRVDLLGLPVFPVAGASQR